MPAELELLQQKQKKQKSSPMTISRKEKNSPKVDHATQPVSSSAGKKATDYTFFTPPSTNVGSAPTFSLPRFTSASDVKRRKSRSYKRNSTGSPEKKIDSKEKKDKASAVPASDSDREDADKDEEGEKVKKETRASPMKDKEADDMKKGKDEKGGEEDDLLREKYHKLRQGPEEKEEKSFFNIASMKRKKEGNITSSGGILYKFSHPLKTSKVVSCFS